MAQTIIQNSFSSGELSPSVWGRTDIHQWHNAASTMRNFFIDYRGGAASRAGFAYVGMCKQGAPNFAGTITNNPPRDINFQFNINQGFALEFGDQYMRVKSNGAYLTEFSQNITGITNSNPAIITIPNHGYNIGDWIFISSINGVVGLNGLTWLVATTPTANTITIDDLFGLPFNSITSGSYISGGTTGRIYTAVSPYAAVDLPYLKFTQSANRMNFTCWNQQTLTEYPPYNLNRVNNVNWVFSVVDFDAVISPPLSVTATATSSTTQNTWYSYIVTAVDDDGNESVASTPVDVLNNNISINAGTNTIRWSSSTSASYYNIYAATPAFTTTPFVDPGFVGVTYGLVGTSFGGQFMDTNIIPDFTQTPPLHNDPFARGSIIDVVPTNPGVGLTQATTTYTISISTGSGFTGTPIVENGELTGFFIQDGGHDYQSGDTITIIGGSGPGAMQATGSFTFFANPTSGQTIIINGITWSFVNTGISPLPPNSSYILSSLGLTIEELSFTLNGMFGSVDPAISVAQYINYGAGGNVLGITYKTTGTIGNSFTLAVGTALTSVSAATLTGGTNGPGATASLTIGPQIGTYPGTVQYFQQRLVYADTTNQPDTYFMSQPGLYSNFDSSIPVTDSDAIIGAPWAQQVNGIQFMVPMPGGLVVLTGKGAWQLNGGNSAAFTDSSQTAQPQAYNGCSAIVPPLVINYDILYVQSKGSIVRDLAYNFFTNIYTGTDTTVLSNQLFSDHQILQWCYAEEPFKIVWAIREDGVLLSLTYLKEQEVQGWSRHDTNGLFVGICSVTEPPVDAVYAIVKRNVLSTNTGGKVWAYYSERMDNRNWENIEQCFCVDSGLSYPMVFPAATLTPAAATGTNNITASNVIAGGIGYTSPVVSTIDPSGLGFGATFSVTVVSGAITAITPVTKGQNYGPLTTYDISDSTGSGAIASPIITNNVTFTASSSAFNSGMVGDVIRSGGGKATITSYVSGTQVIADITQAITATIPNDPNLTPIPQISGNWSISVPTTTVSGLNHIAGQEVAILADGSVVENQTVSAMGSITLPQAASAITVGLPFTPQLQTMYLDPPSQSGTTQSKRKTINSVAVRVSNSRGISIGTNQPDASTQPNGATPVWTGLKQIKERTAAVNAGTAVPLFTGDYYVNVESGWDTNSQVAFEQDFPLPAKILACISYFNVGDTP